jgi:hypothetical protein
MKKFFEEGLITLDLYEHYEKVYKAAHEKEAADTK